MNSLMQKAAAIKLVIFDVDGVLTDGRLYLGETQEIFKPFHIHDGLGIKLLLQTGVEIAIISGRESPIVQQRLLDLGVEHIYQGQTDKVPSFEMLLQKLRLTADQVAYVGDDLPDLPLIRRAGLGITVANAPAFLKEHADWQTQAIGGQGVAREVCEFIMQAQGTLANILQSYL